MEKKRMSVHQGLAELKLLDKRIKNANNETVLCQVNKVSNEKLNGMTKEEFEEKVILASYNRTNDLIERRKVIKTEVVKSNAIVEIEFEDNTKMTVAEAIERKASIDYEKTFLNNMNNQYIQAHSKANRHNENLVIEAERFVKDFYAGKESTPEEVKVLTDDYIRVRKVEVIDPLGLMDKITALRNTIEEFEVNVDFKLSESNATTFIEV